MGNSRLHRRALLQSIVGTAATVGGIGTASALPAIDGHQDQDLLNNAVPLPPVEVTDQTETVSANGLPEQAAGIRPGSQMLVDFADGTTAGCTANFIWQDTGTGEDDDSFYLGAAGHCFLNNTPVNQRAAHQSEDGAVVNDNLEAVKICANCTLGGAAGLAVQGEVVELGDVIYARQGAVDDDTAGIGNDFGLVEIPPEQSDLIDPSLPQFGGPHGVLEGTVPSGELINQYGAGVGNGEVFLTQGRNGVSFGDGGTNEQAWFGATRATPGDSGGPIQTTETSEGLSGDQAGGIVTHITSLGTGGTTITRCKELVATDIDHEIAVVDADSLSS